MKNAILRLAAVFMCLVMTLSFSSCTKADSAQDTLEKMFDTLKDGKYTEARDCYISKMGGDNDFLGCKDNFKEGKFDAYEMHMELFNTMDYKILKTVSDESQKVTFLVEITALDLEPIADELFMTTEEFNFMAGNNESEITETEINEVLTQQMIDISRDYLKSDKKKFKTTQLEVPVLYEKDGSWRVYPDDKLVNVLTGGVYNRYHMRVQEYLGN